jgi:ribosomal protein L12E/L44/L45/RPP1/RPP2
MAKAKKSAAKKTTTKKKGKDTFSLCNGIEIDATRLNRVVERNGKNINKVLKKAGQMALPEQSLYSKKNNTKNSKDAAGNIKQVNDKLLFSNMDEISDQRLLESVKGSLNQILAGKA